MEETLENATKILSGWQSQSSNEPATASFEDAPQPSLFQRYPRDQILEFFSAAKALHCAIQAASSGGNSANAKKLAAAQTLLRTTMKKLGREFFSLLKANKDHLYPNAYSHSNSFSDDEVTEQATVDTAEGVTDSSQDKNDDSNNNENKDNNNDENNDKNDGNGVGVGVGVEEVSSAMGDLKLIVDCMMSSGHRKKCLKIYRITRRSIVEDSILHLGVRKTSKARVQKLDSEKIQTRMEKWLEAARFALKQIFLGEKMLCDHLFSSSHSGPPLHESCFAEVCKDSATIFFKIPGKLAKHSKKSPEMINSFFDLYDGLLELSPEIESIFCSDLTAPVRAGAKLSITRVAEGIRSVLSEFESNVQKDASKMVIPGGGVHPLTRYVVNYLTSLTNHTSSLSKVLDECQGTLQSCLPATYFEDGMTSSPMSLWFAWQLLVLLCKIDAKAEVYKESALSYLFLANNLQYVLGKVSGSKLETVLGETWVPKHKGKVIQYAVNYERAGWDKVISSLPKEQTPDMPLDKVRECFRKFNSEFEGEYRKQVDWFALDPVLRDAIKASIKKQVLERYRYMYDNYVVSLKKKREKGVIETVIKFTPEEIENYMSDLLDGPDQEDVTAVAGEETGQSTQAEAPSVSRRGIRLRQLVRHIRGVGTSKDKEGSTSAALV